jgi:NAD-dependent deacetylase sirtuin 1
MNLPYILLQVMFHVPGPVAWVQKQMMMGVNPREVLKDLLSNNTQIPDDLNDMILWRIIVNILSEPAKRSKLSHINTLDDVIHLMSTCKKIVVLTGAGVS